MFAADSKHLVVGFGITGLSIVKAVMEQHQQKFGVKNHEDGVEFWFELDAKALTETGKYQYNI